MSYILGELIFSESMQPLGKTEVQITNQLHSSLHTSAVAWLIYLMHVVILVMKLKCTLLYRHNFSQRGFRFKKKLTDGVSIYG